MSRVVDLMHLGRDRVIAAYVVGGVIVDPGPASCLDALLEGLDGEEPRALCLTHIHLDHAGASGTLVERFPALPVYVHERGAPHMVDPSRLLKSAAQLYGEDMDRLWGEMRPVPEANLRVLSGGETVEGLSVEYTPGHASHHVTYFAEDTGTAYVGDVGGVRVPPSTAVLTPTPPPDIDLEAWQRSIELVESRAPERLCLTHFGIVEDVGEHLSRLRQAMVVHAERARAHGQEAYEAALVAELRGGDDEEVVERYVQAAPPDQLYLGLERYWRKRLEREESAAGDGR